MRVVVDTNVIVSALLNPYGPSAQIVSLLLAGDLTACCDFRIFQEYKTVLSRPKFSFSSEAVEDLLGLIEAEALWAAPKPLKFRLADTSDEMFLETALAARADYLITGNLKHFSLVRDVPICSPAKFIQIYRS